MYNLPSRRKKKKKPVRPNLIPILDAVFIFIFFLLMSANFTKIFEINSDVPLVSNQEPPKNKKPPLALTLRITNSRIAVYTGVPSSQRTSFGKLSDGEYDLMGLHQYLLQMKKSNLKEESVILEPLVDLPYEKLINIMDSVRMFRNTDPTLFVKDKSGVEVKVKTLFGKIVFGNIQS